MIVAAIWIFAPSMIEPVEENNPTHHFLRVLATILKSFSHGNRVCAPLLRNSPTINARRSCCISTRVTQYARSANGWDSPSATCNTISIVELIGCGGTCSTETRASANERTSRIRGAVRLLYLRQHL